jgi:hypothetical protein
MPGGLLVRPWRIHVHKLWVEGTKRQMPCFMVDWRDWYAASVETVQATALSLVPLSAPVSARWTRLQSASFAQPTRIDCL